MGKRELLLAGVFLVLGVAVYQLTAPPADPSRPGFSIARLIDNVRREVRGQNETAEGREITTHQVAESVKELRIGLSSGTLTITGEDRSDIEAELHVRSTGVDADEAARLVKATRLKVDEAGALMIFSVDFPREGRQTATLMLKVPSALAIRMDNKQGTLTVSNVAGVAIGAARGQTSITAVSGPVAISQRGQTISIDGAGSLRLATLAGAEARVSNIRGDASFNLQSGELRAEALGGAVEVESRSAELRFEKLDALRGPVRINVVAGELIMTGLRTETRVDGRDTEIRIEMAAAAPLSVYSTGGEPVEVTLPAEGVRVDARAVGGRITLDPAVRSAGLEVLPSEGDGTTGPGDRREEHAAGDIRGGGPSITLRATRGDIVLRLK